LLVRAARREAVERTPVWFMRQAGRILPEYRAIRERLTLVEISERPELAAEVTLQPLRRMALDAAILFADIMTPLLGAGVALEIVEGVGPVIAVPVRDDAGVRGIRPLEPERDVPHVLSALRILRRELEPAQALIGFAGAPFTLASYLIEGRPSREYTRTKAMLFGDPVLWDRLMSKISEVLCRYLRAQIDAGAQIVQLFDSWAGALGPADYERAVLPYSRRILASLADTGVPRIHFATGNPALLPLLARADCDVVSVDWRVPLDDAWTAIGPGLGIQGNLDPGICLAGFDVVAERAREVLRRAGGRPGHVFNLGHGVLPETDPDTLRRLADLVHSETAA
jgi:uroporphyrinogen decarboxylase